RSANLRYVIGCTTLTLMLAAPVATVRLLVSERSDVAGTATRDDGVPPAVNAPNSFTSVPRLESRGASLEQDATTGGISRAQLDRFAPGIAMVWLAGVAILLGRMAGGWWRVRCLHRSALSTP